MNAAIVIEELRSTGIEVDFAKDESIFLGDLHIFVTEDADEHPILVTNLLDPLVPPRTIMSFKNADQLIQFLMEF